MTKNRLVSFTDSVISILMTVLVLGLVVPTIPTFSGLWTIRYKLLIYVISFFALAIYWNNHHHLFQISCVNNGRIMWWNLLFLFFISLIPFATSWVDTNLFDLAPELTFGVIVLCANSSYGALEMSVVKYSGPDSKVAKALGKCPKIKKTMGINALGLLLGFLWPPLVVISYAVSMGFWIVPEKRIEKWLE